MDISREQAETAALIRLGIDAFARSFLHELDRCRERGEDPFADLTPSQKLVKLGAAVVSVSAQEEDITDAILAGASGYVLKDGPVEDVVAGIRAAAAGESLISPRVAAMLLRKIRARGTPKPEVLLSPLSARELEVLQLVSEGKTNPEIAEALFTAQSTVRNHIASILMRLQVDTRVQAAVRAVRDRML